MIKNKEISNWNTLQTQVTRLFFFRRKTINHGVQEVSNMAELNILDVFKYRILSFYSEAKQLKEGKMPLPRMAILHANYLCNHNCEGCDYADLNKKKATMSREQAEKLVRELVDIGINAVEFAGGGEPTLDPNILYLINEFKKNKIAMGLLTNGSMLKGELLDEIVKNFKYLRVSLESGSKEIFMKVKRINREDEFDKIVNNLRNAIELRTKYGSNININIKFTVGTNNYMDMENAIKIAIDLGVDSVQFSLYENVDCKLKGQPAVNINYIVDSLRNKYKDNMRILGNLVPTKLQGKCWLTPIFVIIDALGDVYMCTYYKHRKDRHCLGNIFTNSFREVWFSPKHWDLIKNINPEECNVYNCRFHRYNETMNKLMIERENELDFI